MECGGGGQEGDGGGGDRLAATLHSNCELYRVAVRHSAGWPRVHRHHNGSSDVFLSVGDQVSAKFVTTQFRRNLHKYVFYTRNL